jgi:hypothetical protein
MWYHGDIMSRRQLPHLVALCLLLIAICAGAFYSQSSKRHMMAALFFEGIAQRLEDSIHPSVSLMAEWHGIPGFNMGPTGALLREARELTLISRCLRAESDVLRTWAAGDEQAARELVDEWYDSEIQGAIREGIYPSGLARLIRDKRVYLEFIRIRNQYIEPETNRWKIRVAGPPRRS